MARAAGVAYEDWSSGSAFADFNGDGDLDFYLSNYVEFGSPIFGAIEELAQRTCIWRNIEVFCGPKGLPAAADGYFENGGESIGWRFLERGAAVGLAPYESSGMGVIGVDYAADGDEDVYVAKDSTPNFLYRNDGGRFTDVAPDVGLAYCGDCRTQAGMGLATDDYDGDGDTDLFVTSFSHDHNTLYANETVVLSTSVFPPVWLGKACPSWDGGSGPSTMTMMATRIFWWPTATSTLR